VDDVIQLRRVERERCVEHELTVLKMRTSSHSREIRAYAVGERGVELAPRDLAGWRNGSNGQMVAGGSDSLTIKRSA
jgi:KaiC/GvpD/RAD55 family RecA-like ATPase